jgi:hypothetical protein
MKRPVSHGLLAAPCFFAIVILMILPGCDERSDDPDPPSVPIIVTLETTGISSTSAVSGGKVLSRGSPPLTARGVCWNREGNPDLDDSKTNNGTGLGTFMSVLTDLEPGITYVVRAYAVNETGVAFGDPVSFTTVTLPTVVTSPVTEVTTGSAVAGGKVLHCGGASVTRKGVCWNTKGNPTIEDRNTADGKYVGSFTSYVTGLSAGTEYYLRAYATNSFGTGYGGEIRFRTL